MNIPDDMRNAREHSQNGDLTESGERDTFIVVLSATSPSGFLSCPVVIDIMNGLVKGREGEESVRERSVGLQFLPLTGR